MAISFGDWKLSSSEDEDFNVVKGRLLTCRNNNNSSSSKCKDLEKSIEIEYVSLSERLKRKDKTQKQISSDSEDLPVFNIYSTKNFLSVPALQKENKDNSNPTNFGSIKSDLKQKSPRKAKAKTNEEKLRKNAEAEKRKAMLSNLKTLKPEECMKHMVCLVSHLILTFFEGFDFMQQLKLDFEPACSLEYYDTPCVRWQRKVTLAGGGQSSNEVHDEPEMVAVLPAVELIKMVRAHVDPGSKEQTLPLWMKEIQAKNLGVNAHLVCIGMEQYIKTMKQKGSKKGLPKATPDEIEECLVDLQIDCGTSVLYAEKAEDLVAMIKQLTKSIGEAPYKRMKRQDIQFINEIPSVKVNAKTGEGTKKAWKQMLQQFHNVTPVMATAITDKYPSVISLVEAYVACGADTPKAESLLAAIPVRRGVGTLQTNRRIGPELSYKIYRQLISNDPNEYLY